MPRQTARILAGVRCALMKRVHAKIVPHAAIWMAAAVAAAVIVMAVVVAAVVFVTTGADINEVQTSYTDL